MSSPHLPAESVSCDAAPCGDLHGRCQWESIVSAVWRPLGLWSFWQLRRLEEKRDRNAVVSSRTAEPVAPVDDPSRPSDRARALTITGPRRDRHRLLPVTASRRFITPTTLASSHFFFFFFPPFLTYSGDHRG